MPRPSICVSILACLASSLPAQGQQNQAQALVKEAVGYAKTQGKEALLRETNQGQGRFHSRDGKALYIFVYDMTGVCKAIGYQSQLVGVNRWGVKDPDGKYFIQELVQVAKTKGSGWVDYKYPNPTTGKIETKTSYVEYLDGWIVGCGVYR
ncbi:cache domain-containing protein [Geothrix sp. PMB-07]|uniref:cache domain-containing protein n=1 Tax=Geothrix sp. PMB-07 TaxID=3068640 RepID=UPI002740FF5A|nr:cache domain-containing protein [Geothrix sp. PMB-07]WLT33077.1 cache domain-containing protein [Geothrix sp. PMB-07]